ncbi:MAG: hypothetical protein U1E15_05210 [Hyphomicrobiales bacterium]
MKIPQPNTASPFGVYVFTLARFFAGYAAIKLFSFGRLVYDEREGPGLNPFTRLPDGRRGVSEGGLDLIGGVVLILGVLALLGLAYVWLQVRPG